jgi:predicted RNA-binding protein with PUA-like domain
MPRERFCAWLFQANPRYFNLAAHLKTARAGDDDHWPVTRYRDDVQAGDRALLWQSGPLAGLYGLAELSSDPYLARCDYSLAEIEQHPYLRCAWWVSLRFTQVFDRPVPRSVLQMHPILHGLAVLKSPRGTVFRVTPEQWAAVQALLGD